MTNESRRTEISGISVLHCTGNGQDRLFGKEHYCVSAENFCKIHDKLKNGEAKEVVKVERTMYFRGIPIIYNVDLDFVEKAHDKSSES